MGNIHNLPILTQTGSLVQVTSGDLQTAKANHTYFINGSPIASHTNVAKSTGNFTEIRISEESTKRKIGSLNNGVSTVGHFKGAVSYAIKDTLDGDKQIESAKSSVPVIGSVVGGFLFQGPLASFAEGCAIDSIIESIDSAVHHQYIPYGEIAFLTNIVHGHYEATQTYDFSAAIGKKSLTSALQEDKFLGAFLKEPKSLGKLYRTIKSQQSNSDTTLDKTNNWLCPNLHYPRALIQTNNVQKSLQIEIENQSYERIKKRTILKQSQRQNDVYEIARIIQRTYKQKESVFTGNGAVNYESQYIGDKCLLLIQNPLVHVKRLLASIQTYDELTQIAKINQSLRGIDNIIQNNKIKEFFIKFAPQYLPKYQAILQIQNKTKRASQFTSYLQLSLKELRQQLDNFAHFDSHIQNINAIDLLEFRYYRVGKALQMIAKQQKSAGVIITEYAPKFHNNHMKIEHSGQLTRTQRLQNDLSDYKLANTTQIIKATQLIINNRQAQPIRLIKQINCGGLPIQSVNIQIKVRDSTLLKSSSKIVLRYWRKGFNSQYHDVQLTKSCIAKYWRTFQYQSKTDPLDYLDSGGVIDLLAILGTSEDSQIIISNLACEVKYGSPELNVGNINNINSLITYFCHNVHSNRMTDQTIPLKQHRFQCGNRKMQKLKITFKAKDQGWGNRKGAVFLRTWHPDNINYSQIDLTNVLFHQWKQYSYEDSTEIRKLPINSALQLYCRVGGGGGHQLMVEDLQVRLQLRNIETQQYSDRVEKIYQKNGLQLMKQERVRHNNSTDDLIPLYDQVFEVQSRKFHRINVTFRAKDQGWGNRKGRVYIRIGRPNIQGYQDIDITHDDVQHQWRQYAYQDATRIRELSTGSKLQFCCRVGGGGGHQIMIQNFEATIQLEPLEQDQYQERPKKIDSLITYFPVKQLAPSNNIKTDILPLFKQVIQCGHRILQKVSISFMAKAQGQIDQNSQIYLKICSPNKQPYFLKISNNKFTNNWKKFSFEDTNKIRMVQSNSTIQVCYRFGGKENTNLLVKNFELTLYRGKIHFGIQKCNTFHFSEELKNLPRAYKHEILLKQRFMVEKQISKIYIEYEASGRGQIFMTIFNRRSGKLIYVNISKGQTQGDYKKYIYQWSKGGQDQLPQIGDAIQLNYKTQDTKFAVRNIYYSIEHQDTSILLNSHYHFHSKEPNKLMPLYENKINCRLNQIKKVSINFVGKSKGQGKVLMRITQPNGKLQDINVSYGALPQQYKEVNFQSNNLSSQIPPGSILQFMCFVGEQINVNDFTAEIIIGKAPRPEAIVFNERQWKNSRFNVISKLSQIKIQLIPISNQIQTIYLNFLKLDGKLRSSIKFIPQSFVQTNGKLTALLEKQILQSSVAIGDVLQLVKDGPIDRSNFKKVQVTVQFLPLEIPAHRVLTYEFTDAQWNQSDGKQGINIVGADHSVKLASRILALSASCFWKDSGKGDSTGKLYLVQKDSEGKVKNRIDIFGTVGHNWRNVMCRFDSNSVLVKASEVNDVLSIEREIGQNGQLYVDGLQIVMITNDLK